MAQSTGGTDSVAPLAATPSPNLSDQWFLSQDATFQGRCAQAMLTVCLNVNGESINAAFHSKRSAYATSVLTAIGNNPTAQGVYWAQITAQSTAVMSDATSGGTVSISAGNAAARAALVADANISAALNNQFNSFFVTVQ